MKTRRPNKRISTGLTGGVFLVASPLRSGAEAVALAVVLCLAIVSSPYLWGSEVDVVPRVLIVGLLSAMLAAARARPGGGGKGTNLLREGTWGITLTVVITAVGLVTMVAALGGIHEYIVRYGIVLVFSFFFWTFGAFALFRTLVHRLSRSQLRWKIACTMLAAVVVVSSAVILSSVLYVEPEVGAWALADARGGEILAGENARKELPMASTTKIMTALVTLQTADLDEPVIVSRRAAAYATPVYSNVGLRTGDTLSVRELLMAAMISSGNDADYALAEHLGGGGPDGVDKFVDEMNRKAEDLGLEDTHFENPVGFDARAHHTSAADLAEMTAVAMREPEFRRIVSTRHATVTTQDREVPLTNTNELLFSYASATGIKTGTTPAAGESLVASAAHGDESYVSVVLDAGEDRFASSERLLKYGFVAHDWRASSS